MSSHLRQAWRGLRTQAGFLDRPHDTLYPAVWGPDEKIRPEAREAFLGTVLDLLSQRWPDIRQVVRFAIIGSGASYNWAEEGDLDVQVWVSDEARLPEIRKMIVANLLHRTCADFGLVGPDGSGAMEVQFYAKPGQGTAQDNLDGQPYACYDLDADEWLVKPVPLTPEMYGDLFLLVQPRAEETASEAARLLGDYDRARHDADYWAALGRIEPDDRFLAQTERSAARLAEAHAAVKALFLQIAAGRMEAYTAGGRGIHDERDALVKMLEVWGLFDRLKHIGQGKPGVAG